MLLHHNMKLLLGRWLFFLLQTCGPLVRIIRPWPCCWFKDPNCRRRWGEGLFWCGFFPEQWHLPFQVASKVVSILCSGFWIFLFLFPAAPTLDGPFAIVLALICTKVDSPAGRNLLLLEVWPSYCPTLAIFLHCCFRDGQPQLQAFANCSQWQEGQQVSTSTQAFRPNKCKYLKADYLDEQRNHTCGLFFPSLPLSLQQHEMKRNGGSKWTSQPGTILRTGWRLWLRLTECFRHRKSISSSPSPSEPAWRKHWLTDSR